MNRPTVGQPIPGKLYRLKMHSNIFSRESIYSPILGRRVECEVVLFVSSSEKVETVSSDFERSHNITYRFIKIIVGDTIGYCPLVWQDKAYKPFDLWAFLEQLNESDQVVDRTMNKHSMLLP